MTPLPFWVVTKLTFSCNTSVINNRRFASLWKLRPTTQYPFIDTLVTRDSEGYLPTSFLQKAYTHWPVPSVWFTPPTICKTRYCQVPVVSNGYPFSFVRNVTKTNWETTMTNTFHNNINILVAMKTDSRVQPILISNCCQTNASKIHSLVVLPVILVKIVNTYWCYRRNNFDRS